MIDQCYNNILYNQQIKNQSNISISLAMDTSNITETDSISLPGLKTKEWGQIQDTHTSVKRGDSEYVNTFKIIGIKIFIIG